MKIVINTCYGGFGLSPEGQKEYLEKKGKKAYFYTQTKYKHRDKVEEYERVDTLEDKTLLHHTFTFTEDLGKVTSKLPGQEVWFFDFDIDRTDPDLIAVIEKLGEKANGRCAELSIIEIPDGIEWGIYNYDGIESVEEKHRSWN